MATEAQIAANRRNSQKSTGPRTPEGKAASCLNALQTGIDAQSEIIPGEDPATLETLAAALHDHYEPATPIEVQLVDSIVHHTWLLRRHRRIEAQVWEGERRRLAAITFSDITHGEAFANHAIAFSRASPRQKAMLTLTGIKAIRSIAAGRAFAVWLAISMAVPIATCDQRNAIVSSAQLIVVGKIQEVWAVPWLDGWHFSGMIIAREVLKGRMAPGTSISYRFVCSCCPYWPRPAFAELVQAGGIWLLTKNKAGTWESVRSCSDPGFRAIGERTGILNLIATQR